MIYRTDISDNKAGSADDDVDGALADILLVPPKFTYRFFKGMREIKSVLGAGSDTDDILVIREEYKTLLKVLETRKHRGVVVTGHPGIGSYECWF